MGGADGERGVLSDLQVVSGPAEHRHPQPGLDPELLALVRATAEVELKDADDPMAKPK